jgi:hypothetical protein
MVKFCDLTVSGEKPVPWETLAPAYRRLSANTTTDAFCDRKNEQQIGKMWNGNGAPVNLKERRMR